MAHPTRHATVTVGPQGRVVIPVKLRRALGISDGQQLCARVENGRLVLERRETVLARLRARFANIPSDRSVVDELIAERREEANREAAG